MRGSSTQRQQSFAERSILRGERRGEDPLPLLLAFALLSFATALVGLTSDLADSCLRLLLWRTSWCLISRTSLLGWRRRVCLSFLLWRILRSCGPASTLLVTRPGKCPAIVECRINATSANVNRSTTPAVLGIRLEKKLIFLLAADACSRFWRMPLKEQEQLDASPPISTKRLLARFQF